MLSLSLDISAGESWWNEAKLTDLLPNFAVAKSRNMSKAYKGAMRVAAKDAPAPLTASQLMLSSHILREGEEAADVRRCDWVSTDVQFDFLMLYFAEMQRRFHKPKLLFLT